jgi:hypothetical protein
LSFSWTVNVVEAAGALDNNEYTGDKHSKTLSPTTVASMTEVLPNEHTYDDSGLRASSSIDNVEPPRAEAEEG